MEDGYNIKPEKLDKWREASGKNCCDGYSFGVVQITCAIFEGLDEGLTPEEANKKPTISGYTGFMAGAAAGWVKEFHVRGDEYNDWWNNQFNVSPEKAKGGTVNPALVTIGT